MDLDAILDEAAAEIKPDLPVVPKKRIDPPEIRPWLAATALVTPELRDKWTSYVRRDADAVVPSKFLASQSYQSGDPYAAQSSNKILYEIVRAAVAKVGLEESKARGLAVLVNPVTDLDTGKQLQGAFKKHLLKSLKDDVIGDINFDPTKYPHLAAEYARV